MNYQVHDGPNQYGQRKGTFGLALHMTEGSGGTNDLNYLLRNPARGVSANFFSHADGTIHQMMPFGEASGSMNPANRSTDKGYYSDKVLKAVLGTHWTDPNAYSISIEIGGKRAQGPNAKQVEACIAWGRDMRDRYPSLVGAYGHADQTNTKGCPGTTAAIKTIFDGIGGHGIFQEEAPSVRKVTMTGDPGSITIIPNPLNKYLRLDDDSLHEYVFTSKDPAIPCDIAPPLGTHKSGYLIGDLLAFIPAANATFVPAPVADCAQPIADAIKADRLKAFVSYKP